MEKEKTIKYTEIIEDHYYWVKRFADSEFEPAKAKDRNLDGRFWFCFTNGSIALVDNVYDVKKMNNYLIKDIDGNEISEGDLFSFKYMEELNQDIDLIGYFVWNEDELRYEINIIENDEYSCLSYISNGRMHNFKLLK